MPYQYTDAQKAAVRRNPLNRGSCGYLPSVVWDLEKKYEATQRIHVTTQKERDVKQRTVAAAWEAWQNKKAILDLYRECFPDEFNKPIIPIKKPD
jgi:hypothetical protein